jgi:RNA polymerase-binding transcription factor DksA
MAIKKKKTATVVQKSKSKAAPKKSVPVKKVAAKKIATPVKKVVAKKVATKKAPVKTVAAAKKAPAKKVAVKKVAAKKVLPAKKTVAKKTTPPKKIVAKKALPQKKAALKLSPDKKNSKPIIKNSPVKNTAKAGVKKAAPKKLATQKKETVKKPVLPVKKTAPKVAANKSTAVAKAKPAKEKIGEKVSLPKTITDHQADLKKALSKVKVKNKENQKPDKPFVMPKTNTERARKYEPEFTKSVLDQANEEYNGPTMRYSDSELVEFRELIMRKLETAKKELGYLQGLITRKDQMGGDDSDNRYMTMEDGSLSMEREQLSQMASRQITFIDHLEKAMMRIENKTYGICRVTGKLIDKARLRAVPHATLSIEAKMGIAR